ncbi:MAG TPA: hypothetical protein VH988_20130 [Thermoanaerobaculia bacterium]|jgi:photosystem II stability/assembly factor-like uncharacterized protein|nr:hypothetical protein [Thermoanaerobaculia bacterium]
MHRHTACLRSLSTLVLAILLTAAAEAQSAGRWTRIGPDGGSVLALAAAPSRSSTMYAGLQGGGVFRSTDGGVTWTFAGTRLGRDPRVNVLSVDAKQPGTVYALTDSGLFRSTSGGDGWVRMSAPGGSDRFPTDIAADPRRAGTVYVALDGGAILVSADRGLSWKEIGSPTDLTDRLVFDPVTSTTLYAVTASSGGVFKSTDSGGHWTSITQGVLPVQAQVAAFAIDPRRPQTLYFSTFGQAPYRSVDGGRHWTQGSAAGLGKPPNVWALAVDPVSSVVYAGTPLDGAFRSTNGGLTWQKAGPLPDPSVNALLATGSGLFAGSRSGVSASHDRAVTWRAGRGIKGDSVSSLAIDSQNLPRMYIFDGALFKSENRGASWTRLVPPSGTQYVGPAGPVVVHPNDPQQLELGYVGEVMRSDDGGHAWVNHYSVGCIYPGRIVLDPNDSEVLYTSGGFAFGGCVLQPYACDSFKLDHGQVSCLRDPVISQLGVAVIAVDPDSSSHLYAGGDKLYQSLDAGATWSVLSAAIRPAVLVLDPAAHGVLYAALNGGGVARSGDGGATWQISRAGLPPHAALLALAIDPVHSSTLYAASTIAVYRSTDSGATWAPLGTGLDEVFVDDIKLDPLDPGILYAATLGGGVMMLQGADSL